MKKLIVATFALFAMMNAHAADIFNHLGIGVGVGTTGVSVDVAVPMTKFVTIRPGFNYMPNISYTTDVDINAPHTAAISVPEQISIKGKTALTTGKVLVDFYPMPSKGFHLTVGGYFGGGDVIKVTNEQPGILSDVSAWNKDNPTQQIGAELGDYLLTPDAQGNINGAVKVKNFRPYVGLGFGRSIPNHAANFQFEIGCQFWGTPELYCNGVKLNKDDISDGDGGFTKIVSKISVYPVVNFRIGFRAF